MVSREHDAIVEGNIPQTSRTISPSRWKNGEGIFPRMPRDIRERITERLKDLNKSMRAASLDAGMGDTAIRDLMRRPTDSPTMETIEKLARALNTTAAWLAFEAGPKTLRVGGDGLVNANRSFTLAKVDGEVKAGAFLRAEAFDDDLGEAISAPRDPEYPFARQVAYRVRGDSMNEAKPRPIRDGDFIICAAWEDLGAEPRDGQLVVVQQTINSGQLRERSVKAIRLHPDRVEFVPMSSNPEHQPIVVPRNLDPDDGREVTILALVRYVFDNQLIR
ncbi:hypothetical protein MOX02_44890 [Methylobacterium oxalidis]|uniref:HTH cro/C1-type domain-containing protein n=2 Tax=Methylobacterium oxalidis TaxID=944322 RepID=A0A512J912_9HYPH|nr:hypothetical protein MOX02_44890 [Methylobacterium oxalidis]GLS65491.1 hypothetical protein GCM10007888_38730 [Methylobacterium oxalidis]